MGIYLNPGNEGFREALNTSIYVDKTDMVACLNSFVDTKKKYVCVSRPRRFGKTMATDVLCAYYGCGAGSRSLFEPLKLAKCKDWDRYLEKFNVVRLTMTGFLKPGLSFQENLQRMQKHLMRDFNQHWHDLDFLEPDNAILAMQEIYESTKTKFVVIIDEWDAIFREYKNDYNAQKLYLDFLRDWFKDQKCVALVYMTGILPIKKYGKHSALNMFDEYSMLAPMEMASFTGFTSDEVQELCVRFGMDYGKIEEWYDGYIVEGTSRADGEFQNSPDVNKVRPPAKTYHLYSPLSVVKAMDTGSIRNYWNNTETYEALAEYIRMDFDGLKETIARLMAGAKLPVNLGTYQNDMSSMSCRDDILALLIHLGYLGYEQETGCVFIPNREILEVYDVSTQKPEWNATMRALKNSQELLEATWAFNEKRVAELLEAAHDKSGNRTYNSEAALSYAVQLAYYKAQDEYTIIPELDTGKGYADLVFIPRNARRPALLVELKYQEDADSAIEQILRRDYPSRLEQYRGNLILVGVNYVKSQNPNAPDFKHHSCRLIKA